MARGKIKIDPAQVLKLSLQGFSTRQIARQLGVHHSSVHARLKDLAAITANPDLVRVFKQNEAAFIDGARMQTLLAVVEKLADPAQLKKIGLGKLAVAYGILFDKARLERDESTANVMSLSDLVRAAHEDQE